MICSVISKGSTAWYEAYKQLCAGAGNTADIMFIINLEQEGFISHAGLETADIADCGFLYVEDL